MNDRKPTRAGKAAKWILYIAVAVVVIAIAWAIIASAS